MVLTHPRAEGFLVESVEWVKLTVWVRPEPRRGDVRWPSSAFVDSFEVNRAQRDVLLDATADVTLSRRAQQRLPVAWETQRGTVDERGLVLQRGDEDARLWTWAGTRANATLLAAAELPPTRLDDAWVLLPPDVDLGALQAAPVDGAVPDLPEEETTALKFAVALPADVARATVAERFADRAGARAAMSTTVVIQP